VRQIGLSKSYRLLQNYWIINPEERYVMIYLLDFQRKYNQPIIYSLAQPVQVSLFPDLSIEWEFLTSKKI